ncbi:unnamed protein product [Withania somnifera]
MRAAYDFSFVVLDPALSFYARCCPWRELLAHPSSYTEPISLTDFTSRVKRNLAYFRVNYVMVLGVDSCLVECGGVGCGGNGVGFFACNV